MPPNRELSVSVVIPTLNAGKHLPSLLTAVFDQELVVPREVIIVDSMSTDDTRAVAGRDPRLRVVPIENFSHGRARNLGAREAACDIVVLMTQDAVPADRRWLANLVAPFEDGKVAAAYSRQVPKPGANPMESFFLATRFPVSPRVTRTKSGNEPLTLEKVFFSNVSSAIRRDILLKYPFDEDLIMSEDQQFSRDVLEAGYSVVYQPSSVVVHSHDYTLGTVFRRYFDSVYSLTLIFRSHGLGTSASMGLAYVVKELGFMMRRHPLHLPYWFAYNVAKSAGSLAAHLAPVLPRWALRRLSLHRYHWK
jgi:rhamnosyltransferase